MPRAGAAGGVYVRRFTRTERALHWVHACAFLALLVTGLVLYVPELSALAARRPLFRTLHVSFAVTWLVALAAVVAVGDRRRLRATLRELDRFDAGDLRWMRRRGASSGKFNAGQKINAALTAAFAVLFAVSGFLLWLGERDTRFRFASTLLLHDGLMYVSLLLLGGHLYFALIHPSTRHALRGITTGWVRAEWARTHHPSWAPDASAQRAAPDVSRRLAGATRRPRGGAHPGPGGRRGDRAS